ncbi:MAG TPA: hypothetical protein VGE40_08285 [Bacilli bacterium]
MVRNWIPYLILVIISLVIGFFAYRKARTVRFIPFYFGIAGTVVFYEYIIFHLFKSYDYKVELLPDPYFDSCIGAVVSNAFSVPAAGLGSVWIVMISLIFMGIEVLFVHYGWYENFWWKTIYTGVSLVLYFIYVKSLWNKVKYPKTPGLPRVILLFFGGAIFHINFNFTLSATHFYKFQDGWLENATRLHTILDMTHAFLVSLILTVLVYFGLRLPIRIAVLILISGCYWGLSCLGYLTFLKPWTLPLLFASDVVTLMALSWFNRILKGERMKLSGKL